MKISSDIVSIQSGSGEQSNQENAGNFRYFHQRVGLNLNAFCHQGFLKVIINITVYSKILTEIIFLKNFIIRPLPAAKQIL